MLEFVQQAVWNCWEMALDAAPWLLIGLVAAALIQAWVPKAWIHRSLGRGGVGSVGRAAVVGIPLPLCSCGVLPTALGLRRAGASRPATVSFLVATPEIGLDSIALSYALLGPFMAVVRPIAAFFSAITAGVMALAVARGEDGVEASADPGQGPQKGHDRACGGEASGCCGGTGEGVAASGEGGMWTRLGRGLTYVFSNLWDDIKGWLLVAIVVGGVVVTLFPEPAAALERFSTGPWAPLGMVLMLVVGVPLYICATASTPIAAALLVAGVSPGTVLVLLLAGPATNLGAVAILRRELGTAVVGMYLLAIAVTSLAAGLATDWMVAAWEVSIVAQVAEAGRVMPRWFAWVSAGVLIGVSIPWLRRWVGGLRGGRADGDRSEVPETATGVSGAGV